MSNVNSKFTWSEDNVSLWIEGVGYSLINGVVREYIPRRGGGSYRKVTSKRKLAAILDMVPTLPEKNIK